MKKNQPRRRAAPNAQANSSIRNPQSAPDPQRLVHELQVHQIELEMQNEELRQTRAMADGLLAQYTALYDFAPVGYLTLNERGRILLMHDSPCDTERAFDALAQHNLANEVVAVRDGAEALDYPYRRGQFADRASGQPAVVLLDLKMPKLP
jgi:hypothetical protein